MRPLACLTLALTISLAMRSTAAQAAAGADMVPRELAEAILRQASGGSMMTGAQLFVGQLPGGFTAPLDVREGSIVGGFTMHGQSTVLVATTASPDAAIATVAGQLQTAGWKAGPLPPVGKGFQEAASASPHVFCSGNYTVTVRAFARAAGGTDLVVAQGPGASQACDSSMTTSVTRATPAEMPTLVNPPGTGPMSSCFPSNRGTQVAFVGIGGMGSYGTGTTLRTSLPPDSVLMHYARQLEDSGWTRVPQNSATGQWSRPDSAGVGRTVTLTVQPSAQARGCYSVSMSVARAPAAR